MNSLNTILFLAFAFSIGINIGMYSSIKHVDFSSRLHALKQFSIPIFSYSRSTTAPLADSYIRNQMHANVSSPAHDRLSIKNNHKDSATTDSTSRTSSTITSISNSRSPQENRNTHFPPMENSQGSFEKFLSAGGELPIVLLTCNRPQYLQATLESLKHVRGLSFQNLLISQDGTRDHKDSRAEPKNSLVSPIITLDQNPTKKFLPAPCCAAVGCCCRPKTHDP